MQGQHIFLVDGSSYIFRAYHALPPLNRKSDGLQVNAVLGFCNMLWKLLRDMPKGDKPTHLAIIFDKSEMTFRNKLYPAVTAQYGNGTAEAPFKLEYRYAYDWNDTLEQRLTQAGLRIAAYLDWVFAPQPGR